MKKIKFLLIITFVITLFYGCSDDYLDTQAANAITTEQVASDPSANFSLMRGVYSNLRTFGIGGTTRHVDYGHKGIMAATDMLAQDIVLNNFNWYIFYYNFNGRQQVSDRTGIFWDTYYTIIADANSVILGLIDNEDRTDAENAVLGQALTAKSFGLFNLVRLYSKTYIGNENSPGVPIPDRLTLEDKPRGTVQDVYDVIIPDLELAVTLLENYSRGSKQEINQSVAQAILANVYLETGEWTLAASNAAAAKSSYSLMPGADYATDGFSNISNSEWMWGADINSETSTVFASFFSHFDSTADGYGGIGFGNGYKIIDERLYNQIPSTDLRKNAWIPPGGSSNPDFDGIPELANVKFIDETGSFEGDYSYMRVAEMYLVEAEARARMNDASAANVLFELVSNRDPDYTLSSNTGNALVEEIYLQRRIELWGEGVSWFDLKRLGKPLDRTGAGSNHRSFGLVDIPVGGDFFLFQIPEAEINVNSLINPSDQNP